MHGRVNEPRASVRMWVVGSAAWAAALAVGAGGAGGADDARSAIEAQNARFMAAVKKGDAAALPSLYTSDGQVLAPGKETVAGAEAIRDHWAGAMASGVARLDLETVEVGSSGGASAWEVGKYRLSDAEGAVVDEGKYVVVWKKEDGAWKLHRDIYNTSRGPAAG